MYPRVDHIPCFQLKSSTLYVVHQNKPKVKHLPKHPSRLFLIAAIRPRHRKVRAFREYIWSRRQRQRGGQNFVCNRRVERSRLISPFHGDTVPFLSCGVRRRRGDARTFPRERQFRPSFLSCWRRFFLGISGGVLSRVFGNNFDGIIAFEGAHHGTRMTFG